jgi:hypothetical protein
MDESKRSPEEILKEAYARLFFKYTVLHPNKPLTKDGVLALVNLMGWDTQNAPVELEESYVKTIENKDLKEMYELLMRGSGARIIYGRLKAIDMKIRYTRYTLVIHLYQKPRRSSNICPLYSL